MLPTIRPSSYVLPMIESHYEVEFDNPSSRMELGLLSITRNGNHGPVTSGGHSYPAHPKLNAQREKRRSKDASSLSRVPEDDIAMEGRTHEVREGPFEGSSSTPAYLGDQSLAADQEVEEEEEEEQLILDKELARQGIYRGSYRRLQGLYSLTPLFTVLVFVFLAVLPTFAYPLSPDLPYAYNSGFPFPLPEVITATAFWGLSYLFHSPTFSFFFSIISRVPILALALSSLSLSFVVTTLRQIVVPILLIPQYAVYDHPTWHDIAFRRVWWLALGWAAAEAIVGIKQGYEGIALYRDVLVNVRRVLPTPGGNSKFSSAYISKYAGGGHDSSRQYEASRNLADSVGSLNTERQPLLERLPSTTSSASQSDAQLKDAIEAAVEHDVDELLAMRGREELEDLYGMPFIHIPVFISCLHRLNSVLFILGSTLLVTAAYMRAPMSSLSLLHNALHHERKSDNTQLFIAFPLVIVLQWILILLHTPRILPRIGVQTFVYVGLIISLSTFFAGLGVWEGII
ncbi:hypothetical protein AGABI2DRAFT_121648 [Agaricus bisporus var. bisporus H97]|uniref:hypothetical protein n=1 Tax=Agaricus bisporus var. bisporus (strain H97 / ATCC MYA-4626 / FGSC 10389) TaxID=936046 RepID=UPI00029F529C|nr:hypothetical protein AGABI2DRAFT_121648 [Agaricus bisporus var. bisporus H97]EKV43521.1 hypothetical protein AGABI2DRAFT_121648 [Agaricus bisporus var. bisporus H97]